jgi:DeoR/GlpR family transcriptional regulator of sugar metabolism
MSRLPDASDAATRMLKLAQLLYSGATINVHLITSMFGVSLATAKRDMVKVEQCLPVHRHAIDTSNGNFRPLCTLRLKGKA